MNIKCMKHRGRTVSEIKFGRTNGRRNYYGEGKFEMEHREVQRARRVRLRGERVEGQVHGRNVAKKAGKTIAQTTTGS